MTTTAGQVTPDTVPGARAGTKTHVVVGFVIYLVLLAWIVLWKLEVPWVGGELRQVKLIPFAPSAGFGASTSSEVVVNLALFVPFGLYLGLLAPSWPWWKAAGPIAGASLTLEAAQYVLAIGSSDVTDVVVNTAAGLAGIGLFALARRSLRAKAGTVMAWVCTLGTGLALLAAGIFIASPLRLAAPPQDRPLLSPHSVPARDAPG